MTGGGAGVRSRPERPLWARPSWRGTNLALLAALLLAFATGVGAVSAGSAAGRWVVVAHGVAGLAVVALVPAKRRVAAGGLRRRDGRPGRWWSLALAALAVGALVSGVVSVTGTVRTNPEPLWLHIALALLLVLPLAAHVLARPVRPRRADLGRRNLLRAGLLTAVAAGAYAGVEGATALAGLPGERRRFTGSHATADLPVTSWLDDAVQRVDAAGWRLTVADADGPRDRTLAELLAVGTTTVRATLDCTSGWYAVRDWTGVPVARLVGRVDPAHRSVRVRSLTGYDRYLPLSDLPHLLLAVGVDGRPLTAGHGFPARLVAPGRRGFWWVKWVTGVELSRRPWWAQSPFPLT